VHGAGRDDVPELVEGSAARADHELDQAACGGLAFTVQRDEALVVVVVARQDDIGAAEGQFPGYRTIESGDFEEERRLFYVAVTRAKNELYISYPRVASRPGPGGMMLAPSRFLQELPNDLYDELRIKRSFGW